MAANDRQVGGDHYKKHGAIQHWDFVVSNGLGYLEGCATKYVARHKKKNGKEDLLKAKHYIDKILEVDYDYVDIGHSLHLKDLNKALDLLKECYSSAEVGSDMMARVLIFLEDLHVAP
jgi:hypothetical protein